MKTQKADIETLYEKIVTASLSGGSYVVSPDEKSQAKKLVAGERCFWSGDYDHIAAYQLRKFD